MKLIKTAFIGVLLIGLVTFSIATEVNFTAERNIYPYAEGWCRGLHVKLPEGPDESLIIYHPNSKQIYLTFSEVNGTVKVSNDSSRVAVYIAHDTQDETWTNTQRMEPGDQHTWTTPNIYECTIFFAS